MNAQEFKLWLTRIPNTEPIMKTERFERGSYLVFDTNTWDAVRKDNFVVRPLRLTNTSCSQKNVLAAKLALAKLSCSRHLLQHSIHI